MPQFDICVGGAEGRREPADQNFRTYTQGRRLEVAAERKRYVVCICKKIILISKQLPEEKTMKQLRNVILLTAFAVTGSILVLPRPSLSHCQIPCGIYDDHARVQSMLEDVTTIEKSVKLITELSGKTDAQSKNQLIRWVMNKEKHAQRIILTISDYFLTQRVKQSQKDYAERLLKHHAVIIAAMNTKQNARIKYVKTLKESIEALSNYYPEHKP